MSTTFLPSRRFSSLVFVASLACGADSLAQQPAAAKVDYARDIRPILANHCFSCHGPDAENRQAGLRLDLPEPATAPLKSGHRAIVPGNIQESALAARIDAVKESRRMPPPESKKPLSTQQKDLLKRWIEQGAEYRPHWAFIAPKRPDVPAVAKKDWPRNAIDHFILHRLEQEKLGPSPEAGRETLLRRASLDLTGLPPSPEEVQRFLADKAPDAYEKAVDRLLASPRYGERMAMHWLDLARYADTNGYNNDEIRTMWPWRDWVIAAYNRNLPYDRFVLEQIAGDMLPKATLEQKIATGFNRNHVLTTEGGIIEEEYRVEYVADRVHTTSSVFLGLSMGCARCHDHKYDPISQKEYYQFFAYFNNLPDKIVPFSKTPLAPEPAVKVVSAIDQERLRELEQQRLSLLAKLKQREAGVLAEVLKWETNLTDADRTKLAVSGLTHHFPLDEGKGNTVRDAVAAARQGTIRGNPAWTTGKIGSALTFDGQTFVELGPLGVVDGSGPFSIAAWVFPTSNDAMAIVSKMDDGDAYRGYDLLLEAGKVTSHLIHRWPDDGLKVQAKQPMSLNAWHHVVLTYDGSRKAAGVKIYVDGRPQTVDVNTDKLKGSIAARNALHIGRRGASLPFKGKIDDVRFYQLSLSADEANRLAAGHDVNRLSQILATPPDKRSAEQKLLLTRFYLDTIDREARGWKTELGLIVQRQAELEKLTTVSCMVMQDMPTPRDTYLLKRGQYDQRGDKVAPGVPAALPPLNADAPRNRLGLARWLIEPNHPLTARVAVNRMWALHFGTGLVDTLEDLGLQGDLPSHPELLDWLATEFIRTGWDVKAMHRLIVTSATYRQSAKTTPLLFEKDPKNRLLARSPRFRLPAETVRDNALAISGLLIERVGGPSVKPYQPPGLWEDVSVDRRYKYVIDKGEGLYRRSMYTFWRRTIPPPAMLTFDAPDRETCVIRRARTNTPLQALILLNDPTYVEAARKLAELMLKNAGSPVERLDLAFARALARKSSLEEQRIFLAQHDAALKRFRADAKEALRLLSVGNSPRDEKLDAAELAAWTVVASTILNLDETITRP